MLLALWVLYLFFSIASIFALLTLTLSLSLRTQCERNLNNIDLFVLYVSTDESRISQRGAPTPGALFVGIIFVWKWKNRTERLVHPYRPQIYQWFLDTQHNCNSNVCRSAIGWDPSIRLAVFTVVVCKGLIGQRSCSGNSLYSGYGAGLEGPQLERR